MKTLDWIFKVGLLIIGIGLIFVYYYSAQNGRYQGVTVEGRGFVGILDTRTGNIQR